MEPNDFSVIPANFNENNRIITLEHLNDVIVQKFVIELAQSRINILQTFKNFNAKKRILLVGSHIFNPAYECPKCTTCLDSQKKFDRHILTCNKKPKIKKKGEIKQENVKKPIIYNREWINEATRINDKKEKEFNCPKCAKIYYSPRLLINHFKMEHDANYKYKCDKCAKVYKMETLLEGHNSREHYQNCEFCKNNFKTLREYKSHLKQDHKEVFYKMCKPFFCETCDKEFTSKDVFLKHLRGHGGIICNICAEKFDSKEEFKTHEDTHPNQYICEICKKGFKERHLLKTHEFIHKSPFNCSICGKSYKIRASLLYHVRTCHNNRKYMCDKCARRFYSMCRLREHQKAVHEKLKCFQCPDCDRKFAVQGNLRLHHRVMHLKLKPYQCEYCGKQFPRTDGLVNHRRNIHGEQKLLNRSNPHGNNPIKRRPGTNKGNKENGRPVDCGICGRTIKNIWYLKKHINTHVRIRKYKCGFCGLLFLHQTSKIRHEKSHQADPENKFVCPICWKRMKTKEELDIHVNAHKRPKRHSCDMCGEAFARKLLLDNHILLKHTDDEEIIKKEMEIKDNLDLVRKYLL